MKSLINSRDFLAWVERSLERDENVLARSNQGTLLKFEGDGLELLVKCAMGKGAIRRVRQRTLLREYQAYLRMDGLEGIPECYGLVDEKYLAIEYVRGVHYRDAEFEDREQWFAELLDIIRGFHDRGISHGDLKSKGNILVTEDQKPCVIDFGTSFVQKSGIHIINNRMFAFSKRLDLNAWVKHKYHGRYGDVQGEDLEILQYTWLERLVRRARGGGSIRYD